MARKGYKTSTGVEYDTNGKVVSSTPTPTEEQKPEEQKVEEPKTDGTIDFQQASDDAQQLATAGTPLATKAPAQPTTQPQAQPQATTPAPTETATPTPQATTEQPTDGATTDANANTNADANATAEGATQPKEGDTTTNDPAKAAEAEVKDPEVNVPTAQGSSAPQGYNKVTAASNTISQGNTITERNTENVEDNENHQTTEGNQKQFKDIDWEKFDNPKAREIIQGIASGELSAAEGLKKLAEPDPKEKEKAEALAKKKKKAAEIVGALQTLIDMGGYSAGGNVWKRDDTLKNVADKADKEAQAARDAYNQSLKDHNDKVWEAVKDDIGTKRDMFNKMLDTYTTQNSENHQQVDGNQHREGTASEKGETKTKTVTAGTQDHFVADKEYEAQQQRNMIALGSNNKDGVVVPQIRHKDKDGNVTYEHMPEVNAKVFKDSYAPKIREVLRNSPESIKRIEQDYRISEEDVITLLSGNKVVHKDENGNTIQIDPNEIALNYWNENDLTRTIMYGQNYRASHKDENGNTVVHKPNAGTTNIDPKTGAATSNTPSNVVWKTDASGKKYYENNGKKYDEQNREIVTL